MPAPSSKARNPTVYAAGWREDSRRLHRIATTDKGPRGKVARVKLRKLLRASPRAESAYVLALIRAFQAVHRAMLAHVERHLPARELRHDDENDDPVPEDLVKRMLVYLRERTGPAFDEMAKAVDQKSAKGAAAIGVGAPPPPKSGVRVKKGKPPRPSPLVPIDPRGSAIGPLLAQAKERNIALVEKAGRKYAADVRAVFSDPENDGLRPEELRDKLVERGNISLSSAKRVATDQTLKLNGSIARARHEAAGITKFVWSAVGDERTREAHKELDGRTFSYDEGLPADVADEVGEEEGALPSTPVNCRCCALPVLDEDTGEDEEAAAGEPEDLDVAAE